MIRAFDLGMSERSGDQPGKFLGDISGQIQAVVVVLHHGLGIGVAGERLHGADIPVGQIQGGGDGGVTPG